jgi:hypothetical protein
MGGFFSLLEMVVSIRIFSKAVIATESAILDVVGGECTVISERCLSSNWSMVRFDGHPSGLRPRRSKSRKNPKHFQFRLE